MTIPEIVTAAFDDFANHLDQGHDVGPIVLDAQAIATLVLAAEVRRLTERLGEILRSVQQTMTK